MFSILLLEVGKTNTQKQSSSYKSYTTQRRDCTLNLKGVIQYETRKKSTTMEHDWPSIHADHRNSPPLHL